MITLDSKIPEGPLEQKWKRYKANAKLEHDKALSNAVMSLMADHIELFKQFSDNPGFKTWLTDASFRATYHPPAGP